MPRTGSNAQAAEAGQAGEVVEGQLTATSDSEALAALVAQVEEVKALLLSKDEGASLKDSILVGVKDIVLVAFREELNGVHASLSRIEDELEDLTERRRLDTPDVALGEGAWLRGSDVVRAVSEYADAPKRPYTVNRPLDIAHKIHPVDSTVYLTDAEAVEHLAHQVIKPAVVEVPLEEVV